jgi:hypothetical protein
MQLPNDVPDHMTVPMQLASIFMPQAIKHQVAYYARSDPTRFVHYTSAEAAISIIRSKRLWMRNATRMADYREVQHGFNILDGYFGIPAKRRRFCRVIDTSVPGAVGAADSAIDLFYQWWNDIKENTFIASVSEHEKREDQHGRLSMWRAFGGSTTRVALVLKVPRYSTVSTNLNIIFSPVEYLTDTEVIRVIHLVLRRVRENSNFLRSVNSHYITSSVFMSLVAGVTCLKHEGFLEEREWRIVYSPQRSSSPFILSSTEIVGGVPQLVYRLPLDASVDDAVAELDVARIFDRLIIGPTSDPAPLREIFVDALGAAGVTDATDHVFASGIPIRS